MVETFVYLTLKDLLYYMHSKNTKIKLTINMCIDLFKIIRLKNEMESAENNCFYGFCATNEYIWNMVFLKKMILLVERLPVSI